MVEEDESECSILGDGGRTTCRLCSVLHDWTLQGVIISGWISSADKADTPRLELGEEADTQ